MNSFCRISLGLVAIVGLCNCSAYRAGMNAMSSAASAVGSAASKAVDVVTPGSNTDAPKGDWNDAVVTLDADGVTKKFVIRLNPALAPKHVANFKKLANGDFYSGLAVHRAIRNYLVQMGDPLTKDDSQRSNWGTGGDTKKVPSEVGGKHVRGAVAMARLGDSLNPDKLSSGSQFYVMLKSASSLNSDYTVFGEVINGLESLDSVASTVVDSNDVPVRRIEIKSVKLIPPSSKELVKQQTKKGGQTQTDNEKGGITKFIERIW